MARTPGHWDGPFSQIHDSEDELCERVPTPPPSRNDPPSQNRVEGSEASLVRRYAGHAACSREYKSRTVVKFETPGHNTLFTNFWMVESTR